MTREKLKKVVGLQYTPGKGLPRVTVKGSGRLAEKVLSERSLTRGPRVFRNDRLVEQLYSLPIDAEISRDTFQLVAILLAHVFSIEEMKKEDNE